MKITRYCEICNDEFSPSGPRSKKCPQCSKRRCAQCNNVLEANRTGVTCSSTCAFKLRSLSLKMKNCEAYNCNNSFSPKSPTSKFCDQKHFSTCNTCFSSFEVKPKVGESIICPTCIKHQGNRKRRENQRRTFQRKYGVDSPFHLPEIQKKVVETNLARYSVKNQFQRDEVKEKIKSTIQDQYGVDFAGQAEPIKERIRESLRKNFGVEVPAKSPIIRQRMRETTQQRYGVDNVFQVPEFRIKSRETLRKNYGVDTPMQSKEIKKRMFEKLYENYGVRTPLESPEIYQRAVLTTLKNYGVRNPMKSSMIKERLNIALETKNDDARVHSFNRISKVNKKFALKLEKEFGINEITFEKNILGSSYDLFVPKKNLLIDINPTITHNVYKSLPCLISRCELPCDKHRKIEPAYHLTRAKKAQDANVNLLQIYDWDDETAVNRLLSARLEPNFQRYSARKLTLHRIDAREANAFLRQNHGQGAVRNQRRCYALKRGDKIQAVATFGPARFGSQAQWEFLRYAVAAQTIIYGGADRLWGAFVEDEHPESVISYVSFDHTVGPVFLTRLQFHEMAPTGPALHWHNIETGHHVPETSLLKIGADRLLRTSYGSRETSGFDNHDIMLIEGYLPVYTAGNRVFRYS